MFEPLYHLTFVERGTDRLKICSMYEPNLVEIHKDLNVHRDVYFSSTVSMGVKGTGLVPGVGPVLELARLMKTMGLVRLLVGMAPVAVTPFIRDEE